MTKQQVTKKFSELRHIGFKVYCFNSNKALPAGCKDFVDYVVLGKKTLWVIELKLLKDKMSPGQKETMEAFQNASAHNLQYVLLEETNPATFETRVRLLIDAIIRLN